MKYDAGPTVIMHTHGIEMVKTGVYEFQNKIHSFHAKDRHSMTVL